MSEVNNTYLLDSFISIDSKVRALMNIQTKELESAHSQKAEKVSPYRSLATQSIHCSSFDDSSSIPKVDMFHHLKQKTYGSTTSFLGVCKGEGACYFVSSLSFLK